MTNAIFANARASALLATLLGAERLNRMADCAAADDALKILSEVNFGNGVSVSFALEADLLIEAEERRYTAFVRETAPSETLCRYLLAEYDYHNAEAIVRGKYLKTDCAPMLGADGFYRADKMRDDIFADKYDLFPAPLAKACAEADALFVSGQANGQTIAVLFRRALYEDRAALSKKDKTLKAVDREKADAANIAVALRSRNFAKTLKMRVAGGSLTDEDLRVLAEESPEKIREYSRFMPTGKLIGAALEDFAEGRPLVNFERLADGAALYFLKKERYEAEGVQPFVRYCFYKQAELANVRIVLSGLNNKIDKNAVKARMRETYEG